MQQDSIRKHLSLKNLDSLIEMLKIDKNYKQALKYGANNYNINPYKINKLKLQEIHQLVNLIQVNYINIQKESVQTLDKKKCAWLANQLKLFIWMAVCHSYLLNKPLQGYNDEDWQFFTSTLTRKNSEDLQFQSKSLFKNFHGNKQKWDEEEEQLLREIIEDEKYQNKWNDISRLLYFRSGKKYYRSAQKCRQHWFNHLDPMLNKNPWALDQDLNLIKQLQASGFKWSRITQIIESKWGYRRTQHMVKNRAKFLCKKYGYKDEKQQGCYKQLKMIEKKLNQQKIKNSQSVLSIKQQESNEAKSSDEKLNIQSVKENKKIMPQVYPPKAQSQSRKIDRNSLQNVKMIENKSEEQISDQNQSSSSSQESQDNIQRKKKLSRIVGQQKDEKSNNKRNVIILYHAQKQKGQINNADQNAEIDEEQSSDIIIGQHVQQPNQNGSENQSQKQQSYYDQYHIIEEVHNPELDFNQDIQFNHDTHGGRMRQRVTHELAQFFANANKEGQNL